MAPRREEDEETELTMLVGHDTSDSRPPEKASKKKKAVAGRWSLVAFAIGVAAVGAFLSLTTRRHAVKRGIEPSTRSKYKKVQGIGFTIYTGGAPAFLNTTGTAEGNLTKNPECVGRASYGQVVGEEHPELQCYIGYDDPMVDVQKRIEIMSDAVARAYELASSKDDPETLKIFIAPEFFWRGVDGAYIFEDEAPHDPDICGPVCQILMGLEAIVAQKKFEDWLFLFGTVIASEKLAKDDPHDFLFYNFAPLYKGYDPAKMDHTGKRFLVPKRYVSSSDFLTPARELDPTLFKELIGEPLPKHDTTVYNPFDFRQDRYNNGMWNEYKDELDSLGYSMIEYDWIMMDNLAMTVEVCFDHQAHTALSSYLGDIVTGRRTLIPSSSDAGLDFEHIPQYQAQISLVSSAGMTVVPESMALTNNGIIFLQDGLDNKTTRMYWGEEGCELGLQFDGGTEAVQREAFLSPTDVLFEHKVITTFERHWLYKNDYERKLDSLFSTKVYPPQITIFDAMDIAEVVSP